MPICKVHSSQGAGNSGSCGDLANYLEKENENLNKKIEEANSNEIISNLISRKQSFFSHTSEDESLINVVSKIDSNKKKLTKTDSKYFAPTISLSQEEQKHLISKITNRNIETIWDLSIDEFKIYNSFLRSYTRRVMDNYALNFNRSDKGLRSGKDLVYFGKIEHFRKFKGTDKKVQDKSVKSADLKPGLNSHIHLIVSRKDKTQKLKLTPNTKERNTKRSIGGNSYQVGFDRINWIVQNEQTFDIMFGYERPLLEQFKNQRILKRGSPKEKDKLKKMIERAKYDNVNLVNTAEATHLSRNQNPFKKRGNR